MFSNALPKLAIVAITLFSTIPTYADGGYTTTALNGNYTFDEAGTIGGTQYLALGVIRLDGKGGVNGTATVRTTGSQATRATVTGFYVVNPDGTGTMTLNYLAPSSPILNDDGTTSPGTSLTGATYNFVITSSVHVRAVRTDGAELVTASIDKQQPQQ